GGTAIPASLRRSHRADQAGQAVYAAGHAEVSRHRRSGGAGERLRRLRRPLPGAGTVSGPHAVPVDRRLRGRARPARPRLAARPHDRRPLRARPRPGGVHRRPLPLRAARRDLSKLWRCAVMRWLNLALLVLVAALLLGGCTSAPATPAASAPAKAPASAPASGAASGAAAAPTSAPVAALPKVRAAWASDTAAELPLQVANEAGLFPKYGLDVSAERIAGGSSKVLHVLLSGELDLAQIGGTGIDDAYLAGADPVYIT